MVDIAPVVVVVALAPVGWGKACREWKRKSTGWPCLFGGYGGDPWTFRGSGVYPRLIVFSTILCIW